MLKKKRCLNCGEKIGKKDKFCQNCGASLNNQKDAGFGMLGQNDSTNNFEDFSKNIFGKVGGTMLNKMLGNAMKMLEKEMQKEMRPSSTPKTNIQLFVNGKRINPENIKITKKQVNPLNEEQTQRKPLPHFSQESAKKSLSLQKKEPQTNVRRLSNKLIYEIFLPEVKKIKDISIVELEEGIEIKALTKNKLYLKRIPINLKIKNYEFANETLILEL